MIAQICICNWGFKISYQGRYVARKDNGGTVPLSFDCIKRSIKGYQSKVIQNTRPLITAAYPRS